VQWGEPGPIEFRVLGPVEAVRDGQSVRLGGRCQRALLALPLDHPEWPVSADWLTEELWHLLRKQPLERG
jgi:DNA-binding SARP family transcriptional activator